MWSVVRKAWGEYSVIVVIYASFRYRLNSRRKDRIKFNHAHTIIAQKYLCYVGEYVTGVTVLERMTSYAHRTHIVRLFDFCKALVCTLSIIYVLIWMMLQHFFQVSSRRDSQMLDFSYT